MLNYLRPEIALFVILGWQAICGALPSFIFNFHIWLVESKQTQTLAIHAAECDMSIEKIYH